MTYGFIGLGNMASAILRGMAKAGVFAENALVGYNPSAAKVQVLQNEMPLRACSSARETAEAADVVVLAVKPQVLPDVLPQIAPVVTAQTLVVSIAAGKPTAYYEAALSDGVPVVRVMPNIAARVGASASAVCGGKSAQEAHLELVRTMFRTVGAVYDLPEKHFPAFGALGGASGAFVFLYIDALASAGVKAGLPRALAQQTPVILLDEPTAFLDMPNRYELCTLLAELAHGQDKCILFSTHELDIALNLCDDIALIAPPHLYLQTVEQTVRSGHLERLFASANVTFDPATRSVIVKR